MLDTILSFIYGLDPWLILAILAVTPFGEARASIVYGLAKGLDPAAVFFASVFLNILVVIPLLLVLRQKFIMDIIHKIMGRKITRLVEKNKKKFELYEELALFSFVAVPFVGTGAWTGALLSTVLELDRKKSFLVIAAGVLTAGAIVFLGTNGFLHILM